MPSALENRLGAFFSDEPATRVMNGQARWPANFGTVIDELRSIMVHVTAGWPARVKAEEFVKQYIGPPPNPAVRPKAGIGTQYFLAGDGTVAGLIDMPRVTWHGNHTNGWAIGVETGNLSDDAAPPGNRWRAMGPNADQNADDVPGAKLWFSGHHFREVVVSWWTTNTFAGPARGPLGNVRHMLFTEWQYRSWALLARFLCEQYDLPRNFALLPHAGRGETIDDSTVFRRIALADERFPVLVRSLAAHDVQEEHFETANAATLEARYDAAIRPRNVDARPRLARRNDIWTALFGTFRGIHSHRLSGSNTLNANNQPTDHDCPGPVFDWHRFAREVWDWWWYPFDLSEDLTTASTTPRPERRANGDTPLLEYYWDGRDVDTKQRAYHFLTMGSLRASNGIFDDVSSPSVFRLPPEVPIYAPANGVLVAARFPDPRHAVDMAFVLVRHEIWHLPNTLMLEIDGIGSVPAHPGRIDYDREPSYVYSLIMHLGRPDGMSFTEITAANPDWLNRVLLRLKECDLGVQFHETHGNAGLAQVAWDSRPPGSGVRPTLLEGWRTDRVLLQAFLDTLRSGEVALAPLPLPGASSIRVILGDFLGHSGSIRRVGNDFQHGIGFEVFASGFVPPTFNSAMSPSGWQVPAGIREPACVFYQSEWAKTPTTAERERLVGIGVNPDLVPWWPEVALATRLDPSLPPQAWLVSTGDAFHVRPLDFLRWINGVTWASEWPKYRVTDANGAEVPRPARPRSRRV